MQYSHHLGATVRTASLDQHALRGLRAERIDWRFKGMPSAAFGTTVAEFLQQQPGLTDAGFIGPLLVLDDAALEHNLRTMADWCTRAGVQLAPHGKTTMAPQLFQRQIEHGAWGITAANAAQLRVYRAFGVSRVLLANQLLDPHALAWAAAELDRDPGFELCCFVDSTAGVRLMTEALTAAGAGRQLPVLVELGGAHGRTGARSTGDAMAVAAAVADSPVLDLAGVGGYEAAMAHGLTEQDTSTVDDYLAGLRDLAERIDGAGLFTGREEIIATCGGSSYFDQVAEALTAEWHTASPVVPVIRSGAYLTHDDGLYRRMSPFGRPHRLAGEEQPFRPALRIWAQVTSQPEPGLALLTMGRRDVSFDQHLPEPQVRRRPDGGIEPLAPGAYRVTSLADQHAFLATPPGTDLQVGDWIGCGLSHPCTVFDKWPLIPVVDGDRVTDLVRTFF
ncbi:amino acid deaminase [Saccharopolyspora sp. HNM0983]|uniref:Amino acid deaminase n=1 Tax=Saccharopolyspora montiporae TaxID=2781240 RepID=A0A929BD12_9PSEU|nr:amino acid deaminase [Saccharopolyspora sp. HNM0983]MBE9375267.1 amino acid deaminase [Saccharopolyspora sp. HNM0983]